MSIQCSNCNGDAIGYCICDLASSPLCVECFPAHTSLRRVVHILLPLDIDKALTNSRVGDYIERVRTAELIINRVSKHIDTLNLEKLRHLEDLTRLEQDLHSVIQTKFQLLREQVNEVIRLETAGLSQLCQDLTTESRKVRDEGFSLASEMILKFDTLNLFDGLYTSRLQTNSDNVKSEVEKLQALVVPKFETQMQEKLLLGCCYYLQPGASTLTAYDPVRNAATQSDIVGWTFQDGLGMCLLSDDQLFVCGGGNGKSAGIVNLRTKTVTPARSMGTSRTNHGAARWKGTVFAFGGTCPPNGVHGHYESYNIDTGIWAGNKPMSRVMKYVRTTSNGDTIYLSDFDSSVIELFSAPAGTFKSLAFAIPTPNAYSCLICDEDYLALFKGNTLLTFKVLPGDSLQEIGRCGCDESNWNCWMPAVKIGKSFYFLNYASRKMYSLELKDGVPIVTTRVNYQVTKS